MTGGLLKIPQPTIGNDSRWIAVLRIVASAGFVKSKRLSDFLLYVCECAILGKLDEVSEQHVGIHVFDREPDYNSSEDNIVRVHARLLRKKLDEYYLSEAGRLEQVRVLIPKGAYLPIFENMAAPAPVKTDSEDRTNRHIPVRWIAAALLLAALVYGGVRWMAPSGSTTLVRQFWGQVFNASQPALVVSSDTSLVLFQEHAHREVTLREYVSLNFWRQVDPSLTGQSVWISQLGERPYTNNVDLSFCWRLGRLPGIDMRHATLRPARQLGMAELKGANVVLIGARRSNPWVELFDQKNNFQGLFDRANGNYIANRVPLPAEQSMYRETTVNGAVRSFALVEYNRGLTSNDNVLILSGLTSAGTEGAADFLLNESRLESFLESIAPLRGRVPHFELLLAVDNVNSTGLRAEIVTYRVRKD